MVISNGHETFSKNNYHLTCHDTNFYEAPIDVILGTKQYSWFYFLVLIIFSEWMNRYPLFFVYSHDNHPLCSEGVTRNLSFSWDQSSHCPRSLFPCFLSSELTYRYQQASKSPQASTSVFFFYAVKIFHRLFEYVYISIAWMVLGISAHDQFSQWLECVQTVDL